MGRPKMDSIQPLTEESAGSTLRAFFRTLRRRWLILLVCVVVVPIAAFLWSQHQTKEYSAGASLLFLNTKLDKELTGPGSLAEEGSRGLKTNVNLAGLGPVADRTAEAIDQPGVTGEMVAGATSVEAQGETNVARVTTTTTDPELAAEIANTYAREYIAVRKEANQRIVNTAKGKIEEQIATLTPAELETERGEKLTEQVQELEVLSKLQTGDAEVVQEAVPDTEPVAPHPKRNAAIGLVVGILLGVGIVLLLEQFDTRLKDETEVEEAYGLPALGRIPHAGKVKPLDRFDPIGLGPSGTEAFRLLHANLRYFNVANKVDSLVITSGSSGEGKTTVAWGLATTEARSGKSVLLIEADLRQPSLGKRIGSSQVHGLSRVLAGIESFDDAVLNIGVGTDETNELHVLLAGPIPPNSTVLLESPEMSELLEEARRRYDLVVIDTPPTLVADPIALMPQVSGVLVVSRLRRSRKDVAHDIRDLLTRLDTAPLGVVINDAPAPREGYYMPNTGRSNSKV